MKYTRYMLAVMSFLLSAMTLYSQSNRIYEEIQHKKAQGSIFELETDIFRKASSNKTVEPYFHDPSKLSFLNYTKDLSVFKSASLSIELTLDKEIVTIDLFEVDESFYNYEIVTSAGERYMGSKEKQRHFRGSVRGKVNSIVSMSFFDDDVTGLISTDEGNYNLGVIKGSSEVIIYNDRNLKNREEFNCSTPYEDAKGYDSDILFNDTNSRVESSQSGCVRFYYETEFDIYQNLGSVGAVENYVTSLNNQVATLYQNESIGTIISEIFVWTSNDPYTAGEPADILNQFQANTSSINGDLGQLLTMRSIGGGIAAGFNGICNSNVNNKLAVSGSLSSIITPVPTYSYNVEVVTHEFGHLFGSRHTHACVWNGNNTAIDSCSGFTEGSCPLPGSPAGGGTIMSYCHTTVGINFNLGFGPQPGNVIRNSVTNDACLQSCNTCVSDLTITDNVLAGQNDEQEAENTVTAINTIQSGGTAAYDAGITVTMTPGFHAKSGSNYHAFIDGCNPSPVPSQGDIGSSRLQEDSSLYLRATKKELSVVPNPTHGQLTIQTREKMVSWELNNQLGSVRMSGQANSLNATEAQLDISNYPTGIYFLKVVFEDGEISTKAIIKE